MRARNLHDDQSERAVTTILEPGRLGQSGSEPNEWNNEKCGIFLQSALCLCRNGTPSGVNLLSLRTVGLQSHEPLRYLSVGGTHKTVNVSLSTRMFYLDPRRTHRRTAVNPHPEKPPHQHFHCKDKSEHRRAVAHATVCQK